MTITAIMTGTNAFMNDPIMIFVGIVACILDPINAAIGLAVGFFTKRFIGALILGLMIAGLLQGIISNMDAHFQGAFVHITATEIYVALAYAYKNLRNVLATGSDII